MSGSNCKLDTTKSNTVEETAKGNKEGKDSNKHLGHATTQESFRDWNKYYETARLNKIAGMLDVARSKNIYVVLFL